MQLIKPAASYIALPLTNMLNSFIKKEKFPTKWKTFSYLEFEHQPNYQIIDQYQCYQYCLRIGKLVTKQVVGLVETNRTKT